MAQIVICNSVTVIDATHYECVGMSIVTYTGSTMNPSTVSLVLAGQWMTVGFFTMFGSLGLVLIGRTVYKQFSWFK